jgi:dTMP kinase
MDVEEGLRRADTRATTESRFESKGTGFHRRVRQAFLDLAGRESDRFVIIDAARDVDDIAADIVAAVMPRLVASGLS